MTTEEIEKAAQLESDNLTMYTSKWDFKRGFHKGAEFANKHWQEKTRWIPVKERLPEVRKTPFFIAVTAHDGGDKFRANIKTFLIRDESDIRWMVMNCKYWKEIE